MNIQADSFLVYTGQKASAINPKPESEEYTPHLLIQQICLDALIETIAAIWINRGIRDFGKDLLVRSAARAFVHVISDVSYGVLRSNGYDFGKIGYVRVSDLKFLFAPHYLFAQMVTAGLRTFSFPILLAFNIATFSCINFGGDKKKQERTNTEEKISCDPVLSELYMDSVIHDVCVKRLYEDMKKLSWQEQQRFENAYFKRFVMHMNGWLLKAGLCLPQLSRIMDTTLVGCFSEKQWIISNIGLGAISYLYGVKLVVFSDN